MSILQTIITEHWDDVAAVAVMVGGWIFHKAKGDKTKTAREVLDDVVRQVINSEDVDLVNVKTRATAAIHDALAKRKITGKLADALTHEFVEYAAGELAERFDLFTKNLEKMAGNAAKVGEAIAPVTP